MGDEPQKQETEANKRTPHLGEEVPYLINIHIHMFMSVDIT